MSDLDLRMAEIERMAKEAWPGADIYEVRLAHSSEGCLAAIVAPTGPSQWGMAQRGKDASGALRRLREEMRIQVALRNMAVAFLAQEDAK